MAVLRRRESGADGGLVPVALRRFVLRDWYEPAELVPEGGDREMRAYRRWSDARHAWARAHGFDTAAPYGTKPGADWWAFCALVEQLNRDHP